MKIVTLLSLLLVCASCRTRTSTPTVVKGVSALSETKGYALATNGKEVRCTGDDNYEFKLNAARTKIKVTVEGESAGYKKITDEATDEKTHIAYTTSEGTLDLNDKGNTWTPEGSQEAWTLECE